MTGTELPAVGYRLAALVIFALGIGMVAAHTALTAAAAQQTFQRRRTMMLVSGAVGAYLTVWLALAFSLADGAHFPLAREDSRLWLSLLTGFGPMVLAIAILFGSRRIRQLNAAMPSHWLIWAQTYRMAGLMFLFPFLYYGIVPAAFAVPAAVGDFLTGAFAPLVGLAVLRQKPHAITWATAWNLFGVLDLIVAPAAAVLSQAQVLGLYPLALIPLFVGPPLGLLTHVYSLRNLAVRGSLQPSHASRNPLRDTIAGATV